jgi:hypothetical protein
LVGVLLIRSVQGNIFKGEWSVVFGKCVFAWAAKKEEANADHVSDCFHGVIVVGLGGVVRPVYYLGDNRDGDWLDTSWRVVLLGVEA